MSVPSSRSVRRTRGTLALLAGATLWAALGGATPARAAAVVEITSLSAAPSPVLAGNNVTFAVTVANTASLPGNGATNVALTLDVSSGILIYLSETFPAGGDTCSVSLGVLTCDLNSISAEASKTGNIVFQVAPSAADQNLTATFSVISTEDATADTEAEIIDIDVSADLVVDKVAPAPNKIVPGNNVVYTISVTNNGPSNAAAVTLDDPIPTGFGTRTYSGDCGPASCSLGTMAPLAVKNVTVTFAVPDNYHLVTVTSPVVNTATASSVTFDPSIPNRSDSVSSPVEPQVDLTVELASSASAVTPGMPATYVITVSKTGPSRLDSVHIDDNQTLRLLGAFFTPSAGIFSATAISPNWTGLDLAGSAFATLTFSGWVMPVQPGANLVATLDVAPPAGVIDTNGTNNSDSESDTISRLSDLSIVKTNNLSGLIPGQAVPYTITVMNHGPSDISAATVADNFDSGFVSTVSWSCSTARVLTDLGLLADGAGGVDGLDGASAVAVTSDGKHVYATASADNSVAYFTRDATTGLLTFGDAYADGTDASVIAGASAIAISPNGGQVYVTGFSDNGIEVFSRTAVTGVLASVDTEVNGSGSVTGMTGPRGVAVAPDGRHVYVAAATGSAVVVFNRDLGNGTLSWNSTVTGASGLGGARAVAVAPDGRHVVVAGETANGIAVFARNLTTGVLTFVEAKLDGANEGLAGASGLAFSPAGDALYVAGFADNAVVAFSRDLTAAQMSPQLSWAERETDGAGSPLVDGTAGARGVAVSPDGSLVFVAGATDGKIAIFSRNTGGAAIHKLDFLDIAGLGSAVGLAITPAGEQVYGVGSTTDLLAMFSETLASAACTVPAGSDLTFLESVAIPAQSSVTYTAASVLWNSAAGTLVNTATVAAPAGVDTTPANNSSTDSDPVGSTADITVTKTANPASAVPGESVVYTLAVTNAGPANVPDASVTDSGLVSPDYSAVSWNCVGQGGAVCPLPASGNGNISQSGNVNLPAGGTVTYTINVTIAANAAGTACTLPLTGNCAKNTATASMPGTYIDPSPLDHTATAEVPISPKADLSISKTVLTPPEDIAKDAPLSFQIVVRNCGPSNVTNIGVVDTFSPDFTGATWTCTATNGTCPVPANGTGNLTVANATVNLNGGNPATCAGAGQATFLIDGAVVASPSSGVLSNVAKVIVPSGVFDPSTGNNTSSVQVVLEAETDIAIIKTDGPTFAVPGEPITYSITVFNTGPDDAQALEVNDLFPPQLRNVSWTCNSAAPAEGTLTFLEEQRQNATLESGLLTGLDASRDLAIAPGGNFVYATGFTEGALTTFSRDAADGALTYLGRLLDNTTQGFLTIDGLGGANGLVLSPDGQNIYVVGETDAVAPPPGAGKIAVFTRSLVSGLPSFVEAIEEGDVQTLGTVDGLAGAQDLAISPDGKHVYVVSPVEDAVVVLRRDALLSGRLDWLEVEKDGVGLVDGLDGASSVRVSPDGHHVYVTGTDEDAIAVFTRNTTVADVANFGKLTFLQVLKDGVGGVTHLDGAAGIDLAPDGAFAYVAAGESDDAVSVFSRNTSSGDAVNFGKLTFLSERHEGELSGLGGVATGLDGARQAVVSPDGQHLYVASQESDAVVVFQRNPATGSLKYLGVHRDESVSVCVQPTSCTIHSLDGAGALVVDPSGANLYVAARNDSALSVFTRAGTPPAFAFAGGQPASNPAAPVRNLVGGVTGLKAVTEVAVKDLYLYSVAYGDGVDRGSLDAFARDAATGDLTLLARLQDGTGSVDGLDGASALAVYDDNIYVVSQSLVAGENTLAVFTRSAAPPYLSFLELHRQGQFGVSGLFGASDVAVSSDGEHVYVAGRTPGSLAVFSRDAGDAGRLTFREAKIAGLGGIVGLQGAQGLALSSDDRHIYVTAAVDDDVVVFARNTNSGDFANFGRVTEIQVVDGIPGLDRAMEVAASDDLTDTNGSRNIYVTGHTADSLVVFDRNVEPASDDFGKLTLVQSFQDGIGIVDGLNGARAVAVSPDGKNVYVAAEDDDAVAVFAREATGGTLVFVEAAFDGQDGVDGIDQAFGIAISSNSREAYIAGFGDDAIALFRRASGSRCTGAGVGILHDTEVEIAAGGQVVYTVNATIDPGATGQLINEAYVTVPIAIQEPGPDSTGLHQPGVCIDNAAAPPILDNNGCRDIDTLLPRTELAIDKTDGDDVAVPGTEITYTITVRNQGPSNVVGALVQDDLTNIFPTGATWTCVAAPSGTLTFLDDYVEGETLPGPQTISGLLGAKSVAVSPDGEHVYATGLGGDSLSVFSLDGAAGTLAFVASYFDGVGGVDGLNGATGVLVSPDGQNVYVAGQVDDAVAVFTRQDDPLLTATFGMLTFLELQQSPAVAGLDEPVALAMDTAGDTLYVAAANSNAVTVFDRSPSTGALTFLETLVDGVGSVEGLAGASSVAVSFDGEWVYATGENDDAIVVFDRNPATGALTFEQSKVDGVGGTDGLAVPRSVVVSPDDLNVYVAGSGDNAIAVFTRDLLLGVLDPTVGTLTFRQVVRDGVGGDDGIAGVTALAVSDDSGLGFHLYAAGSGENALAIFRRDAADLGRLTFVDAERDGFGGVNGLAGSSGVALSPDGATVVVAGPVDDALALFRRPTDSSCSSGSDFPAFPPPPLPDPPDPIVLEDVVNIAAGSKIVYLVTGLVDPELCQAYPCTAVDLINTATVSSPTDTNVADDSDVDTDDLSPRADLEITKTDHVAVLQGLTGASALAASPDGTGIYATGLIGDGVAVFTRTPATGALTFVESQRDNVAGVDGLNGAAAVVVSGDGAQVYAAGSADNAVVAFSRDAATNELTLLELERNGFDGVTGLLGPDGLALSSDGKNLYAAAAGSSSVAIFGRDNDGASATFGKLGFLGEVRDGVGGADGLSLARGLALSPDDAHLYVVGEADNALAVFSRNAGSGALTFVEFHSDGVAGVTGLAGPRGVAISPDGAQVYVASGTGNAVTLFARETSNASPDFGKLTFVAAYVDGVGGVDGVQGAAAVLVSPDPPFVSDPGGQHVYVAGRGEDAVAVFTRDEITGALTFASAARQGQAGVVGLTGPVALLASPDAQSLYAAGAGDDAVVTFDRDWDSGTLAGTGALAFVESDANGDGTVAPGTTLSYDIVVTNHGPSGIRGALVTDIFPGELENVEWECFSLAGGATCLNGSGPALGDLVDKEVRLPAGSQLLIVAAGTIKPGVTGTIVNTATVAVPNGFIELAPDNNTATDGDTELGRKADLRIGKIACSDPLDCAATEVTELVPGSTIHYEIRVDNDGLSDVQGALVSDVLPELLSDAVWSCVAAPVPGLLSALVAWTPTPPPVTPTVAAVHDGDNIDDISRACALPPLAFVDGLNGARALTVSPDGINIYVAGADDNAVAIFRRDLRNGTVEYTGLVVDGEAVRDPACAITGAVDGLRAASDVEVSADGLHVYVTGELDDAVAVFDRQAVTGDLKFKQFLRDGVAGVNGLGNVRGAALSPDGKHLYTAAKSDNGVGIFARNAATGELTYLSIRVDGSPQPPLTLDGLAGASAVAVSPDGAHVYVAGETDDAVAVFSRDATSGLLTFVEAQKDGQSGGDNLDGASALALSDDGLHFYVAAANDNAVTVFRRDAETGALTFVESQVDGVGAADGLAGAAGVALSPDGEHVYVAGGSDDAVAVLARNPVTGALTPLPAAFDGVPLVDPVDGLGGVRAVVVSPDGEQVYGAGAGEDALALLRRGDGSRCTQQGFGSIVDTVDITAGGSVVYTLSAELSPAATGTLFNTARVTEPDDTVDPDQGNNVVIHGALLTPVVDLTLIKDDGQTEAIPGLPVTYTITLSNAGPSDLADGVLEDLFPVIFEEPAWSCVATSAVGFVEAELNGAGGVTGLDAPQGVAIAPDPDGAFGPETGGDFVYVASRASNALDLFARNAADHGELAFIASYVDGVAGLDGFGGAGGLAISPDGKNLYATGAVDDAVAVFGRDAATGVLTAVEVQRESDPAVDGLDGASAVAVSPDGGHVYVASFDDDALAVFSRDAADGALTYVMRVKDGFGGLDLGTIDDPVAVAVTPDGAQVLVAGSQSDTLAIFARDAATGAVSLQQVVHDGVSGVDGLDLVQALLVSPGGRFVYGAGLADDAIAIFDRDTETGELSFVGQAKNGEDGISGLDGVRGLAMTPDGLFLFATSSNDDAVAIFQRDGLSGTLFELQVARNNIGGFAGLDGARAVAVAPDGAQLYALGEASDAIAVIERVGQSSCGAGGEADISDTVDLAVGGSVTYTVLGTVDSAATGQLINTVTMVSPTPPTNIGDVSSTDIDNLTPVANLAVTKSDGVTEAVPGTATVYLITVTNPGPSDAPATEVTDTLPAEIVSATWTCQGNLGGSCAASGLGGLASELASVPAGGEVIFALAALIDPAATGVLVNTASILPGAGVSDPVLADNSSTDTDLLVPSANLSLVKTVDDALVEIGDPMQFTLVVTNNGPSVATALTVIDLLPGGMVVTGAAGAGWTCTPTASSVSCTLASLAPGATATILLDADAPLTAGNYVNGATVSAATGDPVASNNTGTVPFAIVVVDPPFVVLVDTVADTGDGSLDEMETALVAIGQIDLGFSEDLADPPGDSDPNDVTNPANYRLLEAGRDGLFATSACGAVLGDDVGIAIDSVAYDNGAFVASLGINGGIPLKDGLFRLFACGGVRDLDGNPLDGDGDGTPGDDFSRHFRVRIANVIDRPHFDFASDIDAWTLTSGGPLDIVQDPLDADGFALSGSARLQNLSGAPILRLLQCMALPPEEFYVLSGECRIEALPGSPVRVTAQAEYITGTCLAPTTIFSTYPTAPIEGDTGGIWRRFARPLGTAPVGATAVRVIFSAVSVPGDPYNVRLDNLNLLPTIFADGFETNNTSRWSATAP